MHPTASVERLTPTQRALVADALQRRRAARAAAGPQPRDRSVPAPLSFSQLRLWFLQQWDPQAPRSTPPGAFRLRGERAGDALQRALDMLMQRHEALPPAFIADGAGEPYQVVLDPQPIE